MEPVHGRAALWGHCDATGDVVQPPLRAEPCSQGARWGSGSHTFPLHKAARAVRELGLRIPAGAPGNPNPSLSLEASPEGHFPQRHPRVRHLLGCKQHPHAFTCKGVSEHGKGLAPLEHSIDPKLWAEDAGDTQGTTEAGVEGAPHPWGFSCAPSDSVNTYFSLKRGELGTLCFCRFPPPGPARAARSLLLTHRTCPDQLAEVVPQKSVLLAVKKMSQTSYTKNVVFYWGFLADASSARCDLQL